MNTYFMAKPILKKLIMGKFFLNQNNYAKLTMAKLTIVLN
jgi:hypothetical protein